MLADAVRLRPPAGRTRVVDVGCGVGYMSYVFARAGYTVTGVDGYPDEHRDGLFEEAGIDYREANFNDPEPLPTVRSGEFDLALCGEVVEHILNHLQGFVQEVGRVVRPGGYALFTTPNPSTLMNAVRVARGRHSLWGTREFADNPKFASGRVISRGDIHYREYTRAEPRGMIERAGLSVVEARYLGHGTGALDGRLKRLLKRTPVLNRTLRTRLLGATYYQIARKPGGSD